MPFGGGLMLAGDSRGYRVDLVNDGNAAMRSVTLTSRATTSSVPNTDPVNGLQLTRRNCPVPWTVSGSVGSCAGTRSTFYSRPIVTSGPAISGPSVGSPALSRSVGGVDHLLKTASLPAAASRDAYEGATSSLECVFNATQRAGRPR